MTLMKFERHVHLMKVRPTVVPVQAPDPSLEDILDVVHDWYQAGNANIYLDTALSILDPGTVSEDTMHIADMAYDKKKHKCVMLINRGDESLTDPAFLNIQTKKARIADKKQHEVVGHSAHVLIDLQGKAAGGGHKVLFERVPNIPRSLTFNMINHFLKIDAQNKVLSYKNPKTKKQIEYRMKLDSEFAKSPQLHEDLKKGYLTGVDLIMRDSTDTGLDSVPHVKRIIKKVTIKVEHGIGNPVKWLNDLKKKAAHAGYDEVQVRIDTDNGKKSPRFATTIQDAAEVLYSRVEIIRGFPQPLDQCREKINQKIVSKMENILSDDSLWK